MLNISGYRTAYDEDLTDDSRMISVNSCGHYRLITKPLYHTVRERGRKDYQLLYMARGAGDFVIKGRSCRVAEGQMVLYRPGEPQDYQYALSETPELYWLHFSGGGAEKLAMEAGFGQDGVCFAGDAPEIAGLLNKIILELQLKQNHFYELCNLYAAQLFFLISRFSKQEPGGVKPRSREVEDAVRYFHHHFGESISVQDYAREIGVTPCWFIRNFKAHTGLTPQAYLTGIRLNAAKELLATSLFNVGEIASLTGYPNQLYFSRLFKKREGVTPSEYRLGRLK